jgi:hypothetical protein
MLPVPGSSACQNKAIIPKGAVELFGNEVAVARVDDDPKFTNPLVHILIVEYEVP